VLITAVLCLCAAVASAALGSWALAQPRAGDPVRAVLRAVAPTQLAAAVMLAAGGVAALAAHPQTGLLVVVVCVIGAVGTVAAGSWQGAKYVVGAEAAAQRRSCGGSCATCTLSCN
jgi:hypothetical protein